MKMYLVHNSTTYGKGFCIAGLYKDRNAAIRRCDFMQKTADPDYDRWAVVEVDRQCVKGGLEETPFVYFPGMEN